MFLNAIEENLKLAISQNRLANSYLFLGPRGVGKFNFALRFAKALNCEQGNFPPCENCPSCLQISKLSHPDLHILEVKEEERQIKIDEVRQFQERISYRAFQARWKIAILKDADKLTVQAMNALLKTLEEPPKNTILILTSSNRSRLLPTVVSRCQTIRFSPVPEQEIISWLEKEMNIPKDKARIISSYAEGSKERAEQFLTLIDTRKSFLKNWLEIKNLKAGKNFELAQNPGFTKNVETYLEFLINWYRDLLRVKLGKEPVFNPDFEKEIKSHASRKSLRQILSSLDVLLRLEEDRLNYNIQAQTIGEQIILKLD